MSCTLTGNDHNKRHFYTPYLDSLFKVRRCYSTKCIFARRAVLKTTGVMCKVENWGNVELIIAVSECKFNHVSTFF